VDSRAYITEHFQVGELFGTQHREPEIVAAQENPPDQIRVNVSWFCRSLLEPVRAVVGPLRISSGYRCPLLNAVIGGSQTSAHLAGRAADCNPRDLDLVDAYESLATANLWALDQLILEFGRWIHVGAAAPGQRVRHELLMIWDPGKYLPWDPSDERVKAIRENP
jgi:zinc D-Ala-D-Ala carboxypeptidase